MDCCIRIQYSWKRKDGTVDSFSSMSWFQRGGGPSSSGLEEDHAMWLLPVNRAGIWMLPGVSHSEGSQHMGASAYVAIQWPVGVASTWEDSQRTSQVYMLLSATAHCGHWPASDIKPRLRGIRIFLISSWQIYPPFLSYHPRPGSHIEKNWKHMI